MRRGDKVRVTAETPVLGRAVLAEQPKADGLPKILMYLRHTSADVLAAGTTTVVVGTRSQGATSKRTGTARPALALVLVTGGRVVGVAKADLEVMS